MSNLISLTNACCLFRGSLPLVHLIFSQSGKPKIFSPLAGIKHLSHRPYLITILPGLPWFIYTKETLADWTVFERIAL